MPSASSELELGLSPIWLGCNTASKEIVGDLAMYRREHDINLSTAAFVGAKYTVSAAFTVLQLAVVFGLAAVLAEKIPGDRLEQFLLLVIGTLAGTAIGLLISALADRGTRRLSLFRLLWCPNSYLRECWYPSCRTCQSTWPGWQSAGSR
jgi:ABC transport system ATP-binding/permease protein